MTWHPLLAHSARVPHSFSLTCHFQYYAAKLPRFEGFFATGDHMSAAVVLDDLYRASALERVDRLDKGLPAAVFPWLARLLALSTRTLAQALGISERTLRNRARKLNPSEAELSFRVYRVYRRAVGTFEDEPQAKAWLN